MRLRRVSPEEPGWSRRRAGRGFVYLDSAGEKLAPEDAERVRALVIPPAWEEVWICPRENGHLQAVGTDAAGRRQYLYHPQWRVRRDAEKYDRILVLGRRLPRMREQIALDLDSAGMPVTRAAALAVRLLDLGYFRIGSDVYTEEHGSFGLTTLDRSHVRKRGDGIVFSFTGKSGIEHEITIADPASIVAIDDLRRRRGGFAELLAFKDAGRWQRLMPDRVNDYIREVSGLQATAKDFRTWHATVLAATALAGDGPPSSRTAHQRRRREALKEVADYLGNTPAVARSAYVDPRVLDLYDEGVTIRPVKARDPQARQERAERALSRLLSRNGGR